MKNQPKNLIAMDNSFSAAMRYMKNQDERIDRLVIARLRMSKFIHEKGLDKEYREYESGSVKHGPAGQGTARSGRAWHGRVGRGRAWHGLAR